MGKVLHASGSGYFPGCIVAGDPADCPWTLEKAMQTYWRVRTWTFTASGIATEINDPTDTVLFSSTITGITSHDFQTEVPQTLEEGLVCGNYFDGIILDAYCFIDFSNQAKTSGGLYDSGLFGEAVDETAAAVEFLFGTNISSDFNISILGTNIPISMRYVNDDQEFTYQVTSGSATLTPTLWWSYGGTYNTSTGEPL